MLQMTTMPQLTWPPAQCTQPGRHTLGGTRASATQGNVTCKWPILLVEGGRIGVAPESARIYIMRGPTRLRSLMLLAFASWETSPRGPKSQYVIYVKQLLYSVVLSQLMPEMPSMMLPEIEWWAVSTTALK